MSQPERNKIVYVTSDSLQWMILDAQEGLISPPMIELHRPLVGPVTFYYADCYDQLHIPPEAEAYLARSETVD
jgi:hypothetical protein